MRASRNIYAPNLNLEHLAQALTAWFRTEYYDVERSDSGKGSVRLKCRRSMGNGEAKPSVLVTLHQQNPGLTVDIKVVQRGKPLLITALIIAAIVGLFSLIAGAFGFVIFLLAMGFCVFCIINLMRNSNIPARTFTIIEQFVAAPQGIFAPLTGAPPGSGARMLPPMQQPRQNGPVGGYRPTWSPRAQQPGHYGFTDGQRQTWRPPMQAPGRDEPIGPPVYGTVDSAWDVGASSSRPAHRSDRDEPIGPPAPDTISGKSTFPADDLVPSAFTSKESMGTMASATGAATRACSCGEMNPPDVNFCEGCGKPLTDSV